MIMTRRDISDRVRDHVEAFSLIEMLVVIGTVVVLGAILLPVVSKGKDAANAAKCLSNMKTIGGAMALYRADNGSYKASYTPFGGGGDYFLWQDWVYYYAPYIKEDYNPNVDYGLSVFWCPSFKPTGGNQRPTVGNPTSYWYGDFAAGNQQVNPPVPFPPGDNTGKRHILREQNWYHNKGQVMNLLYGDGHVQALNVKDVTAWPPP